MISAYFDDSGTHRGSPVFVVAGLISTPIRWERLTNEWLRVLASEHIDEFHATDCATGYGKIFGTWSKERRAKLMERLVNITMRHVMYRTWAAVLMADYRSLFDEPAEEFPYMICATGCASRLRQHSLAMRSQPLIPYMFDGGGKGGKAFAAFDELLREGKAGYYRMGPISKGERKKCPPLQAADLHAYEIYKYFADQVARSGRKMRRSLDRLLTIKEIGNGGYLFNYDHLRMLVGGVESAGGPAMLVIPVYQLNRKSEIVVTPIKRWPR